MYFHVLGRQAPDGPVVRPEVGQAEVAVSVGQVDNRHLAGDRLDKRRVGGPRDDAIAVPTFQPGGQPGGQGPLLQEDRPGPVRAQVVRQAPKDLPAVDGRRLDDQGHVRFARHGGGPGTVR
jgi:hypothetical protein